MYSHYTAIFDANVLYPAKLRDLLVTLAGTGLFRARWTNQIHDEWIRNLVAKGGDKQKLERTRQRMDDAIPDCLVTEYEGLIETITLPDPNDRHVVAAAIRANADVIVTVNEKDFPEEVLAPLGIEAQHPDDFVFYQIDLNGPVVCKAISEIISRLKNPPIPRDTYIDGLEPLMPLTADALRKRSQLFF